MPTPITVLYPKESDSTFNLDYYLKNHMPMVQEKFGKYGMKGYRVSKFVGAPGGGDAKFSISCILEFDTVDDANKAFGSDEVGGVLADVPNFSNKEPIITIGEEVGKHSA